MSSILTRRSATRPYTSPQPTRRQRLLVAALVFGLAVLAVVLVVLAVVHDHGI